MTIRREFDAIISAEESKDFQVFMAPVPWIELYAHLANPESKTFEDWLKAVVASYVHTRIGRTNAPKLIPQYLMLVARLLIQHQDIEEDQVLLSMNGLFAPYFL